MAIFSWTKSKKSRALEFRPYSAFNFGGRNRKPKTFLFGQKFRLLVYHWSFTHVMCDDLLATLPSTKKKVFFNNDFGTALAALDGQATYISIKAPSIPFENILWSRKCVQRCTYKEMVNNPKEFLSLVLVSIFYREMKVLYPKYYKHWLWQLQLTIHFSARRYKVQQI